VLTQCNAGDKIENNEMGKACRSDGVGRGVYRVFMGKPEKKRRLGKSRLRWEDNINIDLQEVECGDIDWIELARDRDRWL
jgi:hypothetical protein